MQNNLPKCQAFLQKNRGFGGKKRSFRRRFLDFSRCIHLQCSIPKQLPSCGIPPKKSYLKTHCRFLCLFHIWHNLRMNVESVQKTKAHRHTQSGRASAARPIYSLEPAQPSNLSRATPIRGKTRSNKPFSSPGSRRGGVPSAPFIPPNREACAARRQRNYAAKGILRFFAPFAFFAAGHVRASRISNLLSEAKGLRKPARLHSIALEYGQTWSITPFSAKNGADFSLA